MRAMRHENLVHVITSFNQEHQLWVVMTLQEGMLIILSIHYHHLNHVFHLHYPALISYFSNLIIIINIYSVLFSPSI